jgi:integral membrane sensor domain MASE1
MMSFWKNRLRQIAVLLLTGAFFVPVTAYLVGSFVVGAYEGDGGLMGYLSTIYLSAWHAEQAALILILAPLLIIMSWQIGLWLSRRAHSGQKSGKESGSDPDF